MVVYTYRIRLDFKDLRSCSVHFLSAIKSYTVPLSFVSSNWVPWNESKILIKQLW